MNVLSLYGYVSAKDINIGDTVIGRDGSENIVLGKRFFNKEWFDEQGVDEWHWYLINREYKFFGNQNIYVTEGDYGVCHVSELKEGWKIRKNEGTITIVSIEEVDGDAEWIKFDISGDHSYIGDGVLLHNASRFWQKQNASANWNATVPTNWGSSSGTADNASVPGSSDDVTFDGAGANGNDASTISASNTILSFTATAGYTNTITENASVNFTVAGNFTDNTAHSWTVNSTNGGALTISATSTITSGGKTWPGNVSFSTTSTKTLSGDWTITGNLGINGTTTLNWTTNEILNIGGGLTMTGGFACSGTAKVVLNGTGTWAASASNAITNNLDINTAGTITLGTNVNYNTGTLTYVSGTVTTTSSTLTIAASTTLNTDGITWNNITLNAVTGTLTINSLLTATGTVTVNSGGIWTMAGTNGWTFRTLTYLGNTAATQTFANGKTYNITTALNCFLSRTVSSISFTSDHGTNTAAITLYSGATCNVLANFTRIDASAGRPILTFNGTVTSCDNVFSYSNVEYKTIRGYNRGNRRMKLKNIDKVVEYL